MSDDHVIWTQNLTLTYGSDRGIKDINLTVNAGEVFGFLGPNGAGKSTTIRTLMNFLHPTSGRAEIFGIDTQHDPVAIHALVGNLPGEFSPDDRLTGQQLITYFGQLRGVGDLSYAHELADRFQADLNRPMRRLSRGNKQKIGLIQALFHRPPLLIFDEPTGGLDPLMQEEFLSIVDEVRAEGRTVFFSSHTLQEIQRVADRVGIIRDGHLVTVESTKDMLNKSFRHLRIVFNHPIDPEPFRRLEGVTDVQVVDTTLTFTAHEHLDHVVKLAAQYEIVDMEIEKPTLEEIFLQYYSRKEAA